MVVVAAVDRSDQAGAVIGEADTLARQFEEPIHVLHVMKRSEAIQTEEESVTNTDGAVPVDDLRERAAGVAADLADAHRPEADSIAVGRIGDPATEVVAYAEEQDARYILVSPQQRSQTGKILFGSVAQSVLLNADRPVVSLRSQALE